MEHGTFLNVGEFARICHTTRETLLHYDRKGLLKPAYVAENGYRRYSMKQYFDFDLICLLKEGGSTLEEIRNCRACCGKEGFLPLFRERIAALMKEQERIEHRLSMLKKLTAMSEEALAADTDKLFFEERPAEDILIYPVDSDKITDRESSVECYSACLLNSMADGNAIDPPLGVIIPEEDARQGRFRICHIFTAAWNNTSLKNALRVEEGRYACLFHKGTLESHEEAFHALLRQTAAMGLRVCGPVFACDQMNYALAETGEVYVAKYAVRVKKQPQEEPALQSGPRIP
ncbi:MerR family transcriptional regulator [uncultured Mailhella sp.]|uniref:MerR family transcriptional regulator n=1 Tax=uncultured Mailhella sp. TaxID=1981031 RepID=UPI0025FDEA4E|nr:MerR family transcriptional regulator [uncultured Mailhella sp.]